MVECVTPNTISRSYSRMGVAMGSIQSIECGSGLAVGDAWLLQSQGRLR